MQLTLFSRPGRDNAGVCRGPKPGRARRRPWRLMGALLTTLALVAGALPAGVAEASAQTASAQTGFGPPDLINLSALQMPATDATGQTYAGGFYSATAAQITSLEDLETQAADNTISDHSLDAGDYNAVLSWARPDADAELWALFVQAIQAVQAGTATQDQTNAVDWLTAVAQREGVLSAQAAGLEYTEWAGLGTSAWDNLINSNPAPSESALANFLGGTPEPYTDGGSATDPSLSVDGGYCVFTPPSPDQGQYTANIFTPAAQSTAPQTCFTSCTSELGCNLPTPTLQQFEDWGDAETEDALFDNSSFATTTENIAVGATMGAVASVGSVAAGLGSTFALGSVLSGTSFQTAVFPFAARVTEAAIGAAVDAAQAAGESTAEATQAVLDAATEVGGEVAATGVGVIVSAVIFAVVTAVQEGLSVVTAEELPGQLANFIASAPTNTPDLTSMLGNGSEMQGLYNLFVGSTLPAPTFTSCDNSASGGITVVGAASMPTAPCLNASTVPSQSSSDPQWVVTPKGSGTSTTQPSITWQDAASGLTTATFLHGNWFVDTSTINGTQATVQSLRFNYTDWQGNENTAWLFANANPPEFLTVPASALGSSFDPSTCLSTATCSLTTTIDFVGGDGSDYSASVAPGGLEPPPLPPNPLLCSQLPAGSLQVQLGECPTSLQPTTTVLTSSPTVAVVNQPVTLTAVLSGPSQFSVGGTVEFSSGPTDFCAAAAVSTQLVASTSTSDGVTVTTYTPVIEATCPATFTTTGSHVIFATYSGDEAGDEPSQGQLALPVVNQADTTTRLSPSTSTPVVGQPVTYTATVSDSGPAPTGTVTFTNGSTTVCSTVPLSTTAPYTATCSQTYQSVGDQTVTAAYSGDTGTKGSQGQSKVTVVRASTSTGLSMSPTAPIFGQPVTFTAQVSAVVPSTAGPALTGTVSFTLDGQPLATGVPFNGAQAESVAVHNLAPGPHSVVATYSGDVNYIGSGASSSPTVTCTQTVTVAASGPMTVSGSTCVEAGGSVSGPVNVEPGGALAVVGGTVDGPVSGSGVAGVLICGTTVGGPVSLTATAGAVTLGGPTGSACGPDQFGAPVSVAGASAAVSIEASTVDGTVSVSGVLGPVTVTGNSISGPLSVTSNSGTVNVSSNTVGGPLTVSSNTSPSSATVSANTISGPLECNQNSVPPTDAGTLNNSSGPAEDQCAMLG